MLIMITKDGFYPIETVEGISVRQQAKDHGELNNHIIRVEDSEGKILWQRTIQ